LPPIFNALALPPLAFAAEWLGFFATPDYASRQLAAAAAGAAPVGYAGPNGFH